MAEHSMLHEWIDVVRQRQSAEWCEWALRGVDNAVVFRLGEFSEIPRGSLEHWVVLKPPFPITVLEYSFRSDHSRTGGLLLCVESIGINGFYVIPAEKEIGGTWVTGAAIRGWRAEDGALGFEEDGSDQVSEILFARWALAATVFNLLKCVNVSVVDHPAPKKLNTKRAAKGKTPIYSFKTLMLQVPNERRQGAVLGGTHVSPRVHLRRGHIRQIGGGRSVWVQACVVGVGPGVVEKDYRVIAKADGV